MGMARNASYHYTTPPTTYFAPNKWKEVEIAQFNIKSARKKSIKISLTPLPPENKQQTNYSIILTSFLSPTLFLF